ncbi:MAG: DUF2442 domain-containing protein [Desulfovibrio sp.]|nr:DUF2442 domain-containing protein [Desulfovibrio sp.]
MYILDGIAYAGEIEASLKVISARPLDEYKLWLRFSTGEEKIFDFAPLLDAPCFRPLKDKTVFDRVYVDYGAPVWRDGTIDIAPETLYRDSIPSQSASSAEHVSIHSRLHPPTDSGPADRSRVDCPLPIYAVFIRTLLCNYD